METRDKLTQLENLTFEALDIRDRISDVGSLEWKEAQKKAEKLAQATAIERLRLWKADRWGPWMNHLDKSIAKISGEIT